ncbi:MAG: metalloregulator ArsR/SmtB family transcription factor [Meiothermus sp.]|nr:metalloregulator ArsR/SmtB family transcription factor [Meiothermus sp.]
MQHHVLPQRPNPNDLSRVVELFKALSDPTRVRLVLLLSKTPHTVGALVEALEQPQSTVSRHLAILRAAGLVSTQRQGTSVHYQLSDTHLGELTRQAFSHAEHQRLGLTEHTQPARVTSRRR